jgi:O-glycosyl hydrolase
MRKICYITSLSLLFLPGSTFFAQVEDFSLIRTEVCFDQPIREWDGFGFNYVEEAQFRNPEISRQDYGGFSYLEEDKRDEIIELVFGEDGLRPGLLKMFLDPFHRESPEAAYDHTTTTSQMLEFARKGYAIAEKQKNSLQVLTTLYGPPGWMTRQKVPRGRDLDPAHRADLAHYLVDWALYLAEEEKLPLRWISLHNEGDDWQRWPQDGGDDEHHYNHDYNLYWSPEQVVDFLNYLPGKLRDAGLGHIGLTPGECYGWDRFVDFGYANAICQDINALSNLGLITSHGFISWGWKRWNPSHTSRGTDMIRAQRPDLHAWVTSTSWGGMDTEFIRQIYSNIYTSKVNGIIPWAGIQRPGLWVGGDPNAGSAFHVFDDGTYEIRKGYYFYKQVCRAGQPGMQVANTLSMDAEVKIIAFAQGTTDHPASFVVINMGEQDKPLHIEVSGTPAIRFLAYRSTDNEKDLYRNMGIFLSENGAFEYLAPARSVTTFYATAK